MPVTAMHFASEASKYASKRSLLAASGDDDGDQADYQHRSNFLVHFFFHIGIFYRKFIGQKSENRGVEVRACRWVASKGTPRLETSDRSADR